MNWCSKNRDKERKRSAQKCPRHLREAKSSMWIMRGILAAQKGRWIQITPFRHLNLGLSIYSIAAICDRENKKTNKQTIRVVFYESPFCFSRFAGKNHKCDRIVKTNEICDCHEVRMPNKQQLIKCDIIIFSSFSLISLIYF